MNWQDGRETLLKDMLAHERVGLVSDLDGTLSPIMARPSDAQITPRSKELLAALNDRLPLVALVSGRGAPDLSKRADVEGLVYIGNHGLEQLVDGKLEVASEAKPYRRALEKALSDVQPHLMSGMEVEDKGATASVHFRRADNPAAVATRLTPVVRSIAVKRGLEFFEGRMIFELRPPVKINKGTAFQKLIEAYRLDAAIFLGDDTTDADAMRVAQGLRAEKTCYSLALGVVSGDTPAAVLEAADLLADGVEDVEAFLDWLLSAANASAT
jgi:trehalose 6-phosphate phosphatase